MRRRGRRRGGEPRCALRRPHGEEGDPPSSPTSSAGGSTTPREKGSRAPRSASSRGRRSPAARGRARDDRRRRLLRARGGGRHRLPLCAEAAGYSPQSVERGARRRARGLRAPPAATLEGLVVDDASTPVPGAAITLVATLGRLGRARDEVRRGGPVAARGPSRPVRMRLARGERAWVRALPRRRSRRYQRRGRRDLEGRLGSRS